MRQIIFSKEFDLAVEGIGGYRLFDAVLETVIDGLRLNPYGFPKEENDWVSFRYATTKRVDDIPPLVIYFQITQTKDVELTHVEILEDY
jgi:hypothetical protein